MPRYLVETLTSSPAGPELLADRFPEVEVERVFLTDEAGAERVVVVCRAPSEAHVARWLDASRTRVERVRRIAGEQPGLTVADREVP